MAFARQRQSGLFVIRLIDAALLDDLSREAQQSPRLRRNRNFHPNDEYLANRLLNAIEPGSYVRPHRHLEITKDETILVLRGRLGLVLFDDTGSVTGAMRLGGADSALGVDLPHGTWHAVTALESGTVFFEAKAGPYRALTVDELASWAPIEGSPEAVAYLVQLQRLFS
jgi:cupin fold WbuC family metalloprotein